ncbi:MAG: hypothetical protein A2X49_14390 [Lentisphaerae bacterium GWF2_52_8]|nr:MAG: hypothetical protein A2X49_14390 [Lentisphaerae bacterium GWF2_52_8]OGW20853.1 MAG: hypothetical protein A2Z82_04935 [Nitrospirae bacterium GWA2_46_11]
MSVMNLRPHHVLDIVTKYGNGVEFKPHPYGHAEDTVAQAIISDMELKLEFIVGADEICYPCKHLGADGLCDDVLSQLDPPISKQEYNDALDCRLFAYLGLVPKETMTIRQYLEIVNKKLPGIEEICTHPKQDPKQRLEGLIRGLVKLGIR